jgi:preprotein translocase subunit Sec63
MVLLPATATVTQTRTQYMQSPGKRDQEAFLSQFEPLDVLCLPDTCSAQDVTDAFNRLTLKYGPQGPSPDPKMIERVRRAHEVLTDPSSPYYTRAHAGDNERQRLQFDMLPKNHKKALQLHVVLTMILVAGVAWLVIHMALKPMRNVKRAATR